MVKTVNSQNFEKEVLSTNIPVLVYFWANWCSPCKMLSPIIEELASMYEDKIKFVKLNVEDAPQLASRYMVMSVPTLIIFKNGSPSSKKAGFSTRHDILNFISANLL
jgi:thioredoxin 1